MNARRAALAGAIFLLVLELLLRLSGADMRALRPLVYFQVEHVSVHRPLDDELLYGLQPGARARFAPPTPPIRVSVNSLGLRGPERAARKPKGVLRIAVVGGSNTYGPAVNDDETYPAQLERLLGKGYEVWNAGVNGYVGLQKAAAAERLFQRHEADLVVIQNFNRGRRALLPNVDIAPYFRRDPALYLETLTWVPFRESVGLRLIRNVRLYRALLISVNHVVVARRMRKGQHGRLATPEANDWAERRNVEALKALLRRHPGKVALFYPLEQPVPEALSGLHVPIIRLHPALPSPHPEEFHLLHPPAHVYTTYARVLRDQLEANGLLKKP